MIMQENMLFVETTEFEEEVVLDKKVIEKDIKCTGWGLIWYTLINLLVGISMLQPLIS